MASSSSSPVAGSTTRSRPSGATPTGFTARPSSLISSGSDQSTHRDHSATAVDAESVPEAHEHSFSVSAAESSLTAFLEWVGGWVGGGRGQRERLLLFVVRRYGMLANKDQRRTQAAAERKDKRAPTVEGIHGYRQEMI